MLLNTIHEFIGINLVYSFYKENLLSISGLSILMVARSVMLIIGVRLDTIIHTRYFDVLIKYPLNKKFWNVFLKTSDLCIMISS